MGTKRKLFCWLLFAAAEIIVLAVAAGYFYVLDHGPLHLALTVIFLLCHIALCALARGKWFCLLFGNQFTPDDVLDGYPVDRLMHDIALVLMAVQTQTTEILDEFPTKAAKAMEAAVTTTPA